MRQQQFDLMKGIGMILVLVGHVSCPPTLFNDIYLFHMPLFFFASGCFFMPGQQTFNDYLSKNVRRLLIPFMFFWAVFFFFNLFEAVVWPGADGISAAVRSKLVMFGVGLVGVEESLSFRTIWFLICLFEVSVIYWFMARIKDLRLRSVLSFAVFGAGALLQCSGINLPYFVDSALTVQFYYHLGSMFTATKLHEKRFSPLVSVAVIAIVYLFFNRLTVFTDYRTNRFVLASVPLTILLVWNVYNLCRWAVAGRLADTRTVALLTRIGVDSLLLLGLHRSFYLVMKPLLEPLPVGEYWVSAILVSGALAGTLMLSKPLNRHIPKLTGGKPK